jgi:hypothetical protein
MGFSQAHTTIKVKRVVRLAGQVRHSFGRGVSESVARCDDEILKGVFFI